MKLGDLLKKIKTKASDSYSKVNDTYQRGNSISNFLGSVRSAYNKLPQTLEPARKTYNNPDPRNISDLFAPVARQVGKSLQTQAPDVPQKLLLPYLPKAIEPALDTGRAISRGVLEAPLMVNELVGGKRTNPTPQQMLGKNKLTDLFFGKQPLKSQLNQAETGGVETLSEFGVKNPEKYILPMAAIGFVGDASAPGVDDILKKTGMKTVPKVAKAAPKVAKTVSEVQDLLKQQAKVAPKILDSGLPVQDAQKAIGEAYKYLSSKVDSRVIDELVDSGVSPVKIRQVMSSVSQKTYDTLAADSKYAKNYINKLLGNKPAFNNDEYMRGLVESEPVAKKVDELKTPVLDTVLVNLENLDGPQLKSVIDQLEKKLNMARMAEEQGKSVVGGSAFIKSDLNKVIQYYSNKVGTTPKVDEFQGIVDEVGKLSPSDVPLVRNLKDIIENKPDLKEDAINALNNVRKMVAEEAAVKTQGAKTNLGVPRSFDEWEQTVLPKLDSVLPDENAWSTAFQQREAGVASPLTESIKEQLDFGKKLAQDLGFSVGTISKDKHGVEYVPHFSQSMIGKALDKIPTPDTFGSVLSKPIFTNRREWKVDPIYSRDTLRAYMKEAFKNANLSAEEASDIKLANEIQNEIRSKFAQTFDKTQTKAGKTKREIGVLFRKGIHGWGSNSIDVVSKIKNQIPDVGNVEKTVYDIPKNLFSNFAGRTFRSVNDRAAMVGNKYYDSFLYPFRKAIADSNIYESRLRDMSEADFAKELLERNMSFDAPITRDQVIGMMSSSNRRELMGQATNAFKEAVRGTDFRQDWLKELTNDIFDEYVGRSIREASVADEVMTEIRKFSGRGALGFNITSPIMNLLENKRLASVINKDSMEKAVKSVASGIDYVKKYGYASERGTALERGADEGRLAALAAIDKIDPALFYMFDKSERLKDNLMLAGFEAQGIKKGLKGDELWKYVTKKTDQFAIKYGMGQDIGLYRSPVIKTLAQFGQYPVKDSVIFVDKVAGAVGGDKGDAAYAVKYATLSAIQMLAFKAMFNQIGFGNQTNTPWDFASDLSKGEIPVSPLVQSFIGISKNISDEITGKQLSDYDQEQRNKNIQRSLGVATIPAFNQISKTGRTIGNQIKGYQETFSGNVANEVSRDPINLIKTLGFGPSYDPKRQEYDSNRKKGESSALTGKQSDVYKNLSDKTGFFDKMSALNKQTEEIKTAKAEMEEPTKGNFLSNILGAKSKDLAIPTKDDPPTVHKAYKSYLTGKVDLGEPLSPEEANYYYLEGKTLQDQKTVKESDAFYTSLYKASEDLEPQEFEQLLQQSGVNPNDFMHYQLANEPNDEKLRLVSSLASMQDKEKMVDALISLKKKVGNKAIITSTEIDYLYDKGLISEDEKKFINAVKFDELTGTFYFDRDYKGGSGVGSSGLTLKQEIALLAKVNKLFETPKYESQTRPLTSLFPKLPKIKEERTGSPKPKTIARAQSKGFWFAPY